MADIKRKSRVLCLLVIYFMSTCSGLVHELTSANFEKFLKGKFFVLTFVDSPSCTRCRILFPFYVAASQVFPHDPEIFFTRTHDKNLIQEWGVTELPALVYHRDGFAKHEFMNVDITVDDIIDEIARVLMGNFAGLTRTYTVHLNDLNFDEIIVTPRQSAMMLIHNKDEKEELKTFERVAYAFRKDDAIVFATLDVSKHRALREKRFQSRDTPVIIWYGLDHKPTPKRFGGVLSQELLVTFVNERTGLNRNEDGSMLQQAGRVPEIDEIIEGNLDRLLKAQSQDLKEIAASISALREKIDTHHHEMLDYYLYIIDNIALAGNTKILRNMVNVIDAALFGNEDISTKTHESLKRQKNILNYFKNLEKNYVAEEKRRVEKEKEEKKKEEEEAKKETMKHTIEHSHIHTEL